ncbi:rab2a [Anaeramoeba flamelloides]|uniref:Rab2a n=1 Tax=Anaeramoeba flamelloides TaxID=1746091 RepID=A0AAV7YXH7_9EUKA|nr:rab2a member ras oncogene family [Anaeramoeba flamelloides]KAJ6241919.1 rab2a [Anaeramoeba flamelloides]
MNNYRFVLKYIIVGSMGSGKSSILCRFIEDEFYEEISHTIGIEFSTKILNIGTEQVKIQIWDTAGQEKFRAVTRSYYRGASCVLLVYDTSRRSTLNESRVWLQDAKKYCGSETIFILIGNKIDFTEREVTYEEGKKFAEENGLEYIETSAKTGQNVSDVFLNTASRIYRNLSEGTWKLKTTETIDEEKLKQDKQTEESKKPKSGGCC